MQRDTNQLPSLIIDLDGCTIEKETDNVISIESNKKLYNLRFPKPEIKEEWAELIRLRSKNG